MNKFSSLDWRKFDFVLFATVILLSMFGVTAIHSAAADNSELANHYIRQSIFGFIGICILLLLTFVDYRHLLSLSTTLYIATIALLLILNVVANAIFGSARWFSFFMVNIQPSEIAKIVNIIFISNIISKNREKLSDIKFIIFCFLLVMIIAVLIILQPNLSTAIVILFIGFTLIWAGGMRNKHVLIFVTSFILVVSISLPILIEKKIVKPYQINRVINFINPDEKATYGEDYNVIQALTTIGSGGLWGQGYRQGTQVQFKFLKVRHSDFIFSVIANEFGFVGGMLLMGALVFVVIRCLLAIRRINNIGGALICFGVAVMLALQIFINIGVNLRLLPVTGLTLPFISYGGSSLIINYVCIGLVESVLVHNM